MHELGARIRAEGFPDEQARQVADAMIHPDVFARTTITTWMTDAGPLDILRDIPNRVGLGQTFTDLVKRSTNTQHHGITVRLAALADIINSKMWVRRPKDRAALGELDALLRDQEPLTDEPPTLDYPVQRDDGYER